MITLTSFDLFLAAFLVLLLALCFWRMQLNLAGQLLQAALRTTVQLCLVGLVLRSLFSYAHPAAVLLMALVMLLAAGREVTARQHRRLQGWWAYGIGASAMFLSSFTVTVVALVLIVQPTPWYMPQYAIPLLGMLLGNTMNGVSLCLNRLTQAAWEQREVIEQRLLLGQNRIEAMDAIRRDSLRTGMIPIVNAMAAAGLISLPGMMTGQILAGSPPWEAVKYQILIMFLIAAGTGGGILVGLRLASRRLFDERHRLRLDRLR